MSDVLAVVPDMFFASRITATARAVGCSVRFLTQRDEIQPAPLAVVDLGASLDVPQMISDLKRAGVVTVVAFGPHVDTESRREARAAGADRVFAKSRFVTELPQLLEGAMDARVLRERPAST